MTPDGAVGTLSFVATPIGNLGDLTHRAEACLREATLVACEDTRHSARLLDHYGIHTPRISLHAHNEAMRSEEIIRRLKSGESIAVISDAGMPGISDPGQRLLQRCLAEGLPYDVLPGPSAVLTALVGSGLPTDGFYFGGFLPNKSGQRTRCLEQALARDVTSIYFESPHRLLKSLTELSRLEPLRPICVARELTKHFQDYRRGTATEVAAHYTNGNVKGEIVILIAPPKLPKWSASYEREEEKYL